MEKFNHLPVYYPEFSEDDEGISKISLVKFPAFERNFQYYSDANIKYSINEDKREVTGPVIIANTPVLRDNPPIGPHYMIWDEESIIEARDRFFRYKYTDKTNIHHETDVEGLYIVGSFIKDERFALKGFEDLPDGSWLVTYKVENDDVWQMIKSGDVKGFSMEVLHDFKEAGPNKYNITFDMNLGKRFKYSRFVRSKFGRIPSKYASVMTDKGELAFDGEMTAGAMNAVLYTPEPEPAPDGEYRVLNEAGEVTDILVLADQEITEVKEPTDNMQSEEEEVEEVKEEAKDAIEEVIEELVREVESISSDYSAVKAENEKLKSDYSALKSEMEQIKTRLKMPVEQPEMPEASCNSTSAQSGIKLGTKA